MTPPSNVSSTYTFKTVKELTAVIRQQRRQLGLNQSDLAGLSGLSVEGLSKIERGDAEPKLSTILQILKILGGSVQIQWKQQTETKRSDCK